ncbi:gas vesicle protein [Patescibacteria group bacterium]|nr:gas vesicle protein [Patescibacteria group bacterium]
MAEQMTHSINATNLADILERVLEKGIVIAGDIKIQLADIDLLNIKIRLLVASVDKAMEMGINWWQQDSYLSTKAKEKETQTLEKRVERLEKRSKA